MAIDRELHALHTGGPRFILDAGSARASLSPGSSANCLRRSFLVDAAFCDATRARIIIFHIFIILYGIFPFVHSIISPIIVISFHNIVCIIHGIIHVIIVIFFFFIDGLIFLVVSSVVFPICDRAPSSASWYAASSFVLVLLRLVTLCSGTLLFTPVWSSLYLPIKKVVCKIW